jgi:hypothetical protein
MKFAVLLLVVSFNLFAQDLNFQNFKRLTLKSIELREEVIKNEAELERMFDKDHVLTGKELDLLNKEAMERFEQTEQSLQFIDSNDDKLEKRVKRKTKINEQELKQTMMALALGLTMADSHLFAYAKIASNKKLRRLVNEPNQSYDKEKGIFTQNIKALYSAKNRKKMKRAIELYQRFFINQINQYSNDVELMQTHEVIQDSYTFQKFVHQTFWEKIGSFFQILGGKTQNGTRITSDVIAFIGERIIYGGSKFFGNSVGMLQSRRGKLYKSQDFMNKVSAQLRPMDMILEKTPFRATDRFIPGYYGHAAIYVGTEADLKAFAVWDHPAVQAHHEAIKNGAVIVEALRPGVQINTLEHFTDIDDFAILRLNQAMSYEETQDHLIRTFQQIGKKYDFSFDVETGKEIVCSELQFVVYVNVPFNTSKIVGRSTISVDQAAEQGLTGRKFSVIELWVDGLQVEGNVQAAFDKLMLTQGEVSLSEQEKAAFNAMYNLSIGVEAQLAEAI